MAVVLALHDAAQTMHRQPAQAGHRQVVLQRVQPSHAVELGERVGLHRPPGQLQHRHSVPPGGGGEVLAAVDQRSEQRVVRGGRDGVVGGHGEQRAGSGEWGVAGVAWAEPLWSGYSLLPTAYSLPYKGASRQVFAQESDARRTRKWRKSCVGKAQRIFPHARRNRVLACHDLRAYWTLSGGTVTPTHPRERVGFLTTHHYPLTTTHSLPTAHTRRRRRTRVGTAVVSSRSTRVLRPLLTNQSRGRW